MGLCSVLNVVASATAIGLGTWQFTQPAIAAAPFMGVDPAVIAKDAHMILTLQAFGLFIILFGAVLSAFKPARVLAGIFALATGNYWVFVTKVSPPPVALCLTLMGAATALGGGGCSHTHKKTA